VRVAILAADGAAGAGGRRDTTHTAAAKVTAAAAATGTCHRGPAVATRQRSSATRLRTRLVKASDGSTFIAAPSECVIAASSRSSRARRPLQSAQARR
jgi:hypothetical protein